MDPEFKRVRPSLNESVEFLLHEALIKDSIMTNNGQYFLLFVRIIHLLNFQKNYIQNYIKNV